MVGISRRDFSTIVGELGFFAKRSVIAKDFLLEFDASLAIATSGLRTTILRLYYCKSTARTPPIRFSDKRPGPHKSNYINRTPFCCPFLGDHSLHPVVDLLKEYAKNWVRGSEVVSQTTAASLLVSVSCNILSLSGSHRSTRIASDLASQALASQAKPQQESESQAFRIARS